MSGRGARDALDYPRLDDALFILWASNGVKWPAAGRQTSFLTHKRREPMKGAALFSPYSENAATFQTEEEARAFLADNEAKRGFAYGVTVSTVAEMKTACGYN